MFRIPHPFEAHLCHRDKYTSRKGLRSVNEDMKTASPQLFINLPVKYGLVRSERMLSAWVIRISMHGLDGFRA